MSAIPPALVVDLLVVLIASQLLYAFFPYRRRAYLPVLLLTALGVALGQLWDVVGLPGYRLGGANLLPALLFVLLLQPLAQRLPIRFR
ncbi:MAG: hypothetical protein ABI838_03670 [Chloroflexota bacterium]